jgi:YaiO family outer membrane protein
VIAGTGSSKDAKHTVPASRTRAAGQQRSELELGISSETLSNGLAAWRSIYLEGLHQFGERQVMYGTLRETRRFGLTDSEAQGGFTYPVGKTWTFLLEASLSPTHNVLPNFSLMGQLRKELDHGWNLQAGIRHSEYSRFNTDVAIITAERYWNSFRGAYSSYLARLDGGSTVPNHVVQFDYYYGDRNSIGILVANGREIADLGPGGPLITDVRSYVLRGRHWIGSDWAISYEALHYEQGGLYARQGARVGLRRAF